MELLDLPDDMLYRISNFLHPDNIMSFAITCKLCYNLLMISNKEMGELYNEWKPIYGNVQRVLCDISIKVLQEGILTPPYSIYTVLKRNVIFLAVEKDAYNTIKLLILYGGTVEPFVGIGSMSPFHLACLIGNFKMMDYLLKLGANINKRFGVDSTFHILAGVHWSVQWCIRNYESIRGMLQHACTAGDTILHMAIRTNNIEMVEWLLTLPEGEWLCRTVNNMGISPIKLSRDKPFIYDIIHKWIEDHKYKPPRDATFYAKYGNSIIRAKKNGLIL